MTPSDAGVTMGCMAQRSIRFPDELEARLVAAADADGRTFSNFVVRALEDALAEEPPRVPTWASQAMWNSPALEKQFVEGPEPAKPAAKKKPAKKPPAELPRIAPRHWGKS